MSVDQDGAQCFHHLLIICWSRRRHQESKICVVTGPELGVSCPYLTHEYGLFSPADYSSQLAQQTVCKMSSGVKCTQPPQAISCVKEGTQEGRLLIAVSLDSESFRIFAGKDDPPDWNLQVDMQLEGPQQCMTVWPSSRLPGR